MEQIVVVNRHRYTGKDAIYIGRGTPLGNPFKLSDHSREACLTLYRQWLRAEWKRNSTVRAELIRLAQQYKNTQHLVLSCSCKPLACHGDIIVNAIEALIAQAYI